MLDDQAGSAQTPWAEAIIGRAFTGLLGDAVEIEGIDVPEMGHHLRELLGEVVHLRGIDVYGTYVPATPPPDSVTFSIAYSQWVNDDLEFLFSFGL